MLGVFAALRPQQSTEIKGFLVNEVSNLADCHPFEVSASSKSFCDLIVAWSWRDITIPLYTDENVLTIALRTVSHHPQET